MASKKTPVDDETDEAQVGTNIDDPTALKKKKLAAAPVKCAACGAPMKKEEMTSMMPMQYTAYDANGELVTLSRSK